MSNIQTSAQVRCPVRRRVGTNRQAPGYGLLAARLMLMLLLHLVSLGASGSCLYEKSIERLKLLTIEPIAYFCTKIIHRSSYVSVIDDVDDVGVVTRN